MNQVEKGREDCDDVEKKIVANRINKSEKSVFGIEHAMLF